MVENISHIKKKSDGGYKESMENGYYKIPKFLNEFQLKELEEILLRVHKKWLINNNKLYEREGLINSAYITHPKFMSFNDRVILFNLIGSFRIKNELNKIFNERKRFFLNTQLFFDPFEKSKKNYWHRDIQYTNLSLSEQQKEIEKQQVSVVHFRFALRDEKGLELIPGSHQRWDTEDEFNVRYSLNGHNNYQNLPNSHCIALERGDLLIFSANIIHRGLYGEDRLSLDILYCEESEEIFKYSDKECHPSAEERLSIQDPRIFFSF